MTNSLAADIANGKDAQSKALIGKRIQIPVHYDMWMRGARFGVVTGRSVAGRYIRVKLDLAPIRPQKVFYLDLDYIEVL